MALKLTGGIYKNKTTSLYSPDGIHWFEDDKYTIIADKKQYKTDDGDRFLLFLIFILYMLGLSRYIFH